MKGCVGMSGTQKSPQCMLRSKLGAYILLLFFFFFLSKITQNIPHCFLGLTKSQQCQVVQKPGALSRQERQPSPWGWLPCFLKHRSVDSGTRRLSLSSGTARMVTDSESFVLQLLKVAKSQQRELVYDNLWHYLFCFAK